MINIIITHLVQEVLPLCSQQVEVPVCPQAWGDDCSCDQLEPPEPYEEETVTRGAGGHLHDDDTGSGSGQPADEESSSCQPDCLDTDDEARPVAGGFSDVGQTISMAVKRLVLRCRPGQKLPNSCHPPHVVSHNDSWSEYTYENPGWRASSLLPVEECGTELRGHGIGSKSRAVSKVVTWRSPPQRRPAMAKMSQPRYKRHLPLLLRLHSCESCLGRSFCHVDCDVHTAVQS